MRKRDSLLEALVLFKKLSPAVTVNQIITFLYTCENEGLNVQELAYVARFSQTTASRSLRGLGPPDSIWALPPKLGLLEASFDPADGRSHLIHLTERGRAVRDTLDRLIRAGIPINPGPESHDPRLDVYLSE